jgi:hypothetical protein
MGNLKEFVAARVGGTFDEHVLSQFQRYSTRILDFPGFGRHVIETQDVDVLRDLQNHVSHRNSAGHTSYLMLVSTLARIGPDEGTG